MIKTSKTRNIKEKMEVGSEVGHNLRKLDTNSMWLDKASIGSGQKPKKSKTNIYMEKRC